MKKGLVLVLVVLFLASLVTLQPITVKAQTKTIIVPDEYPTIQSAINHASSGDIVFVKNGLYNGTLVIDKSISLIGENQNNTIIDAQKAHSQVILIESNNITIANLTLGNSDFNPPHNSGWYQENGEGDGIRITGQTSGDTFFTNIINNTIIDCPFYGIDTSYSEYNTIVGNTIISSVGRLFAPNIGISVYCLYSVIENNSFETSGQSISFYTIYLNGFDLTTNNLIQGNQNITLATIPTPFPPIAPTPSPNPTPSPVSTSTPNIPEFPSLTILMITFLITATLLGTVVIKRKQSIR